MKTAIMSDIHSNPYAFNQALADARKHKCTELVCLGDVVGYGYDPVSCIKIITEDVIEKGMGMVCVLGNHDAALCGKLPIDWFSETAAAGVKRQEKILSDSERMWLSSLGYKHKHDFENGLTAFYAHGAYVPEINPFFGNLEQFPYMHSHYTARENFKAMKKEGQSLNNVLFVGHTHERMVWEYDKDSPNGCTAKHPGDDERIDISNGGWIINVGSVGYPRLEPFTSYVIFDSDKKTVEFRTLHFLFRDYVNKMRDKSIPIPHWMDRWYNPDKDQYYDDEQEEKKREERKERKEQEGQ